MTPHDHASQRARVSASLRADDGKATHHDVYARRSPQTVREAVSLAIPHIVELDDVEQDLLAELIHDTLLLTPSRFSPDMRAVLAELRERIRPAFSLERRRPEDMAASDGLGA